MNAREDVKILPDATRGAKENAKSNANVSAIKNARLAWAHMWPGENVPIGARYNFKPNVRAQAKRMLGW